VKEMEVLGLLLSFFMLRYLDKVLNYVCLCTNPPEDEEVLEVRKVPNA
jgi:hypothetical protein